MWTKWVTIHQSYGLPRVAQEFRTYLENRGVRVRLQTGKTKRSAPIYYILVPIDQKKRAETYLADFKKSMQ